MDQPLQVHVSYISPVYCGANLFSLPLQDLLQLERL